MWYKIWSLDLIWLYLYSRCKQEYTCDFHKQSSLVFVSVIWFLPLSGYPNALSAFNAKFDTEVCCFGLKNIVLLFYLYWSCVFSYTFCFKKKNKTSQFEDKLVRHGQISESTPCTEICDLCSILESYLV